MKYLINRFLQYLTFLNVEFKYHKKNIKRILARKKPHQHHGRYVIQPIFGTQFLKKVMQDNKPMFVFKVDHKGAEMFTKKQAKAFIKIYKKAGKFRTRFVIVKKRVTTLLEEIEKEKIEQEENEAANMSGTTNGNITDLARNGNLFQDKNQN